MEYTLEQEERTVKKILLLLVLLLLCSCSEARKNSPSESESQPHGEALENDTFQNTESPLEKIGSCGDTDIYIKSSVFGERIELSLNGAVPALINIPNIEYEITDSDGNPLIDHPFYHCFFLTPEMWEAHEKYPCISGSWKGNYYRYIFTDKGFERDIFIPAGESGEKAFGYNFTRYCWYNTDISCGLNDSEGNVLFEPIYVDIKIPFADRIVLYEGGFGMLTDSGEGCNRITDSSGNTLAVYTTVTFKLFSDGSYIGISSVAPEPVSECFDSKGNISESGYWFIDKNGNRISGRFDEIEDCYNITSPSDILSATDEDGNAVEIKVSDYLCKP